MNESKAKSRSVGMNTLLNSAGALIYLLCQWLITVLVVRIASVEDAGNLSLAMSVTNMFFTIGTFSIRDFQISDYTNSYSMSQYVSTRILTCVVALVSCIIMVEVNGGYTDYQRLCIGIYMVFRVAEAFVDVLQAEEQKAERMDYVFISFVTRGILLLGGFCLVLWQTQNLLAAIVCIAVTSFAVVLLFDARVVEKLAPFRITFDPKGSLKLLRECLPLMINSFLLSAVVSIPRNNLSTIMGPYYLGIYASVATPAVIVQSAAMWLYTPLLTRFSAAYRERKKKDYLRILGKVFVLLAILVVLLVLACVFLAEWGLNLLFGQEVAAYSYLLLPVIMTTVMIALNYFFSALLTVARKLYPILAANAIAFAVSLFASNALIGAFGMDGVNLTLYIGMGASLVVLLCVLVVDLHHQFSGANAQRA